jgi:hypothetical protein
MGFFRCLGEKLGVIEDDKLIANLNHMSPEQLEQHYKVITFRSGTAQTGFVLNSAMILFPGFVFGWALNLRQMKVAKRMREKIKKAMMSDKHVAGTRRYFLAGAAMKVGIFAAFAGHAGAEDFVIHHLSPEHLLEHLAHGDVVANVLEHQVQEMTHAVQHGVHEVFAFPHAFNENPFVEAVHNLGDWPKEVALGVGHHLQEWGEVQSGSELLHQFAVGPAMEANVPQMLADDAMESLVEDFSQRRRVART